ncbi:hypothetical protein P3S68_033687 [Capsicum galapagoense]
MNLDLSYSGFTGVIPAEISHLSKLQVLRIRTVDPYGLRLGPYNFELLLKNLTQLRELELDSVNISSTIPLNFSSYLTTLSLPRTRNILNGTIPQCLGEMNVLQVLDLNNNRLSGTINTTFTTENRLHIINLYGNRLKGKVPPSLINFTYLEFLDLGNNELNDTFPSWLGGLPDLKILSLRSNKLHGPISDSRTDKLFAQIRVIDLSSNGFSGNLPVSLFGNFQDMKIIGENSGTREYIADYYSGYLPRIIGYLVGLRTLNLSHNGLEGVIPASLKHLSVLESLDLSSNKIGGEIPQQLASLTFLAFIGNDGLRGLPLSKDCGGDDGVPQATTPVELVDEEEEGELISWQAVLMGFGCGLVIGLSIIYIMLSTHYPVWFSSMVVTFRVAVPSKSCLNYGEVKDEEVAKRVAYVTPLPPSKIGVADLWRD